MILTKRYVRCSRFLRTLPWIDVLVARLRRFWAGRGSWVGCGHSGGDRLVVVPIQRYREEHSFVLHLTKPPSDPTLFNELADKSRVVHTQRSQPSNIQCSEPSYLQSFVRNSRTAIIDPLFTCLRNDPLFVEAQTEAEAQAQPAPTVNSTHSVITPQQCPVGSSRRRLPALRLVCNTTSHADNALVNQTFMEVDLPKPPRTSDLPLSSTPAPCPPRVRAVAERRSSRKAPKPSPSPRKAPPKTKDVEKVIQTENDKPKRSRGPKSDTFKMAWSVEEQRLLERLLEEIPDGENNRSVLFTSVHLCPF